MGGLIEGGSLEREGVYSQNQVTRMDLVAFSSVIPYFAESTYNFTAQIDKFDTICLLFAKINMQGSVAK